MLGFCTRIITWLNVIWQQLKCEQIFRTINYCLRKRSSRRETYSLCEYHTGIDILISFICLIFHLKLSNVTYWLFSRNSMIRETESSLSGNFHTKCNIFHSNRKHKEGLMPIFCFMNSCTPKMYINYLFLQRMCMYSYKLEYDL